MKNTDTLGDYLKSIEASNSSYLKPDEGIYARLDGKGFSKLTKGMNRPFDENFTKLMVDTAKSLLEITRADLAYVQSDEISLYWKPMSTMDFNGRKEKWIGELSGLATASFMYRMKDAFPDRMEKLPRFDCRLFNVSDEDAYKFFFWRFLDCRKNSVSMVACHHFSHKFLKNVPTKEREERLRDNDTPWEAYPDNHKYGTWLYKKETLVEIDKSKIPEHVHHTVPSHAIRNVITERNIKHMSAYPTIVSLCE